jgi:cell division septal protein FtsQ
MASHQRETSHPEGNAQPVPPARSTQPGRAGSQDPGAGAGERWRQPPPETRAKVRRQQMTVQRAKATQGNPLAPVISRGVELGQSMTVRHWIALLAIAAAAAGFSQILTLDQFTVTAVNVQVRGNQRASTDEIYAASGLEGTNVFRVRAENAAQQIAGLPGVASAEVNLRLPAKVMIDVQELAPLAIVQTITETLWVGSDGASIQQVGEAPKLTLIEDSGTVRDARGTVLPEIVEGLEAIQARRPDLTDIHYGALEGLYLRAPEGYTVYLGQGGAMVRKLALLEATQRQIAERDPRPQVIDLRFDGYAMLK